MSGASSSGRAYYDALQRLASSAAPSDSGKNVILRYVQVGILYEVFVVVVVVTVNIDHCHLLLVSSKLSGSNSTYNFTISVCYKNA